jgi:ATP-binding cassette subfamily B protein
MVAKYHYDRDYSFEFMRDLAENDMDGSTMLGLSQAAEKIGFHTLGVKITLQKLIDDAPLPCILHWDRQHYVVLYDIQTALKGRKYFIADPALGLYTIEETQFALHWLAGEDDGKHDLATSGIALLLEKASDFHTTFFGFANTVSKNIVL